MNNTCPTTAARSAMTTFTTGGHTVYHLRPATVDRSGLRAIVGATYDGSVICHRTTGERLRHTDGEGGFPFDLCVADINQDGLDETLVAYPEQPRRDPHPGRDAAGRGPDSRLMPNDGGTIIGNDALRSIPTWDGE